MTTLNVLPDIVLITIDWLLDLEEIDALLGNRVGTKSPTHPVYPYAVVQRLGGIPVRRQHLDRARIQVSVWGEDEAQASEAARTLRAGIHAMEGYQHAEGTVTGVEDELGLSWLPDDVRTPPTPRFVFSVGVYAHPAPVVAS